MDRCESWVIKKAEHQRTDVFELWCWRRLLRVPWTARRSNQPILKEISPEYSMEGLMLKLKLQYFGHLMQRTDSLEKILMLGRAEGRRRRGRQRMAGYYDQFDESEFEQTPRESEGQGSLACCSPWGCKESDTTEQLNWNYPQPRQRIKKQRHSFANKGPYSQSYCFSSSDVWIDVRVGS